jgi:hypothetical protein
VSGIVEQQDMAGSFWFRRIWWFQYGFKKGGLISMANGGMITVGDKTYSPEDFGFASKGALVKKRKTPAKKKRGKGLASSK